MHVLEYIVCPKTHMLGFPLFLVANLLYIIADNAMVCHSLILILCLITLFKTNAHFGIHEKAAFDI
jgi:hypothetical protein